MQRRNHELLDTSQKPFYLLRCIQLWLKFTLDILTASLAVLVVVLAVTIKSSTTGGDAGVALVNVTSTNSVLAMLIISWTSLEASIGAVSRVRSFTRETPSEVRPDADRIPDEDWPRTGAISFDNVSSVLPVSSYSLQSKSPTELTCGLKIGFAFCTEEYLHVHCERRKDWRLRKDRKVSLL